MFLLISTTTSYTLQPTYRHNNHVRPIPRTPLSLLRNRIKSPTQPTITMFTGTCRQGINSRQGIHHPVD